MSNLFISYSTRDRVVATELYQHLIERGFHLPFLDYHPDSGIAGGTRWEDELRWKLKIARGLIVLCSENWAESKWCFAELDRAKELRKVIVPLNIDGMNLPDTLSAYQAIPFETRDTVAYSRVWRALESNDLRPGDDFFWPQNECPYPGLTSFGEEHAGVFFGRDSEISGFLSDCLDPMRVDGNLRMTYVVGPSGCGKSSFIRAGIFPRLKFKMREDWHVLDVFRWSDLRRRSQSWEELLASAVQQSYGAHPNAPTWNAQECESRYVSDETAESIENSASKFVLDLKDLRQALDLPTASVMLFLDQFEEFLTRKRGDECNRFLRFLRHCLLPDNSPLRVIATLRSDYFHLVQQHSELIPWCERTRVFRLDLLKQERLFDIVRRPAEMVGARFENEALVNRIVDEAKSTDALPLLAFTLNRFYDKCAHDKLLTDHKYVTDLGGIHQCLNTVAQGVLEDKTNSSGKVDSVSENALRVAFVRELVRYDERGDAKEGRFVRRTAPWPDLPEASRPLLEKMSSEEFRLVSIYQSDEGEKMVEVTHEALFRQWGTLRDWLDARQDLIRWREDIDRSRAAAGKSWSGLTPSQLAIAASWVATHADELSDDEIQWIRAAKRQNSIRIANLLAIAGTIFLALASTWYFKTQGDKEELRRVATEAEKKLADTRANQKEAEALQSKIASIMVEGKRALAEDRPVTAAHHFARVLESESEANLDDENTRLRLFGVISRVPILERIVPTGHSGTNALFVGDNDERILLGTGTGATDTWESLVDANDGTQLSTLRIGEEPARKIVISPDGTRVLTMHWDGDYSAAIWDVRTGKRLHQLKSTTGQISEMTFSADGRMVATGSYNKSATVWDVVTGEKLHEFTQHRNAVRQVAFTSDGKKLVTWADAVRIWDLTSEERVGLYDAMSKIGNQLVVLKRTELNGEDESDEDFPRLIRIFDAETQELITTLESHEVLTGATTNADKSLLLSGSVSSFMNNSAHKPGTVRVWDLKTGKLLHTLRGGLGDTTVTTWFANDSRVIVTNVPSDPLSPKAGGEVRLWNAKTGEVIAILPRQRVIAKTPDSKRIVTLSWDNIARIWDSRSGTELQSFSKVKDAKLSPDTKRLLTVSVDNTVQIWNAYTGLLIGTIEGSETSITNTLFTKDGHRIVTISNASYRIWTVPQNQASELVGHADRIDRLLVNSDESTIYTSSIDGGLFAWSAISGRPIFETRLPKKPDSLQLAGNDSRIIATFSNDWARPIEHWIWIIDSKSGQPLKSFVNEVYRDLSPDTNRVLTATTNSPNILKIRNLETLAVEHEIKIENEDPEHVLSDALLVGPMDRIVTQHYEHSVDLWDIQTQKTIASLPLPKSRRIQRSADGKTIYGINGQEMWFATTDTLEKTTIPFSEKHYSYSQQINQHGNLVSVDSMFFSPERREFLFSIRGDSPRLSRDQTLIATEGKKRVLVWKNGSGELMQSVFTGEDEINDLDLNKDGSRLIVAFDNGTARLFDSNSGDDLLTLDSYQIPLSGDPIMSKTNPKSGFMVRQTRQLLAADRLYDKNISDTQFYASGNRAITVSDDGIARIWELGEMHLSPELTRELLVCLTGTELSDNGFLKEIDSQTWTDRRNRLIDELTGLLKSEHEEKQIGAAGSLLALSEPEHAIPIILSHLDAEDNQQREEAAQALRFLAPRIAPSAMRVLVDALASKNKVVRQHVVSAVSRLGPIALPRLLVLLQENPENEALEDILFTIASVGPTDPDAIKPVTRYLGHSDRGVRYQATRLFEQMGRSAVGLLKSALADENALTRKTAATVLGRFASEAVEATQALVDAMGDEDQQVRITAAKSLAKVGDAAIPTLVEALQNDSWHIRINSVGALALFGKKAEPAREILVTIVRTADEKMVNNAATTLAKIGPDAIRSLAPLLKDESEDVRLRALRAIAAAAIDMESDKVCAELLASVLHDESKQIVDRAAKTLTLYCSWYGTETLSAELKQQAIPYLIQGMSSKDEYIRRQCTRELGGLNVSLQNAEPVVTALMDKLDDDSPFVRSDAARALGHLGQVAKIAAPTLVEIVKNSDSSNPDDVLSIRDDALRSLALIGAEASVILKLCIEALDDESHDMRSAAVQGLGKLGDAAKPAIPNLIKAVQSDSVSTASFLSAIRSIGIADNDDAVEFVTSLLEYKDESIRVSAAELLIRSGNQSDTILDALKKALGSFFKSTRLDAIKLLTGLGPNASVAVKDLSDLVARDSESDVRIAAAVALGKIGAASEPSIPILSAAIKEDTEEVANGAKKAIQEIRQAIEQKQQTDS